MRFSVKEAKFLAKEGQIDFLGITMTRDDQYIYLNMQDYIKTMVKTLGRNELLNAKTATSRPLVEEHLKNETALNDSKKEQIFRQTLGMTNWLVSGMRCDGAHAQSAISQYMANPTEGAFRASEHLVAYYASNPVLSIRAKITKPNTAPEFDFMCDSDYAGLSGPSDIQGSERRRAQNGSVIMMNGMPVYFKSSVTSMAFAMPETGQAHAAQSTTEAEIYAAGNMAQEIMFARLLTRDLNFEFPRPAYLRMDNDACKVFCEDSAARTKLKHVDVKQTWVELLRDKQLLIPVHIKTESNLADIFTKILPVYVFRRLRDALMVLVTEKPE